MGFDFKIDINKFVEKYGLAKTLIVIIVLCSVFNFLLYHFVPKGYALLTASISNTVVDPNGGSGEPSKTTPSPTKPEVSCVEERFEDNLNDWQINRYNQSNDGFYCPKNWTGFLSPNIWYSELVPLGFDSLRIKYKAKNEDNSTTTPSAFILTIGENPTIARFYVTEDNYQMVGFQKIDFKTQKLIWEDGRVLTQPIQCGTEVELRVRSIIDTGNKIKLVFNLLYVPSEGDRPIEDSFTYDVSLPDPTPENSMIKIGFGTLKKRCIKPVSYEICPGEVGVK